MINERFPSEKEQMQNYRGQLAAFHPLPVTMRTLDIGGDKALPYFPIKEENPFLGWRGIRITLDHPEIFLVQVRAMLKASEGLNNLRILLPMISGLQELEESLHLIHRAWGEVRDEGVDIPMPPVGVMIEIPAAVYQVRELARQVDFLSVGSNDLTPVPAGGGPQQPAGRRSLRLPPSGRAACPEAGGRRRPCRRQTGEHLRRNGPVIRPRR